MPSTPTSIFRGRAQFKAPLGIGVGVEQLAYTILTNAQVLALRATPITLVPSPGAGFVLEFLSALLWLDYTAAYTAGAGDDMAIRYNNGGTLTSVSDTIEATAFLTASADTQT